MKGTEDKEGRVQEQVLEELFSHASARERPAPEDEQQIRESLREQWQDMTQARKRRKRQFFAAAASLFVAVFAGSMMLRSPVTSTPGIAVATVELVKGGVRVNASDKGETSLLIPSGTLETGQQISTSHEAGFSATWQNGIVVRVDQNSRIKVISPSEVQLLAGRVYVDTNHVGNSPARLSLSTPAGPVRHVGTRYMVSVNLGSTSVSVREGQVQFGDDGAEAVGGERLVMNAKGESRKELIQTYGAEWGWTENLVLPFVSDGRTVSEFLVWVEQESGRTIQYASPAAEKLAAETLLRGDVDLAPMPALALVMQGTDLSSEIHAGVIVVSANPPR